MNRYKNLKIQNKLFLSFGILLSMVIILAIFIVSKMSSTESRYDKLVSGALQRQTYIADAIGHLTKIRLYALSRGYLLDDEDLINTIYSNYSYENYQRSVEVFKKNMKSCYDNLVNEYDLDEPEKQEYMYAIAYIEDLFDSYQLCIDNMHTVMSQNDRQQLILLLSSTIPIGDIMANELGSLREKTEILAETRIFQTKEFSVESKNMAVVIAISIVIISLIASIFMSQIIKMPILDMTAAMAEISKGNLTYPIRSSYRDELGLLANSIGSMVDTISELNKTVAIVDYLDMMIFVTDLDYNLIYINRKMADAYGLDRASCLNQKCYTVIRGMEHPCSFCLLPKLLPQKHQFPSLEYDYKWDDHLNVWITGRSSIIRWVDGSSVHFNMFKDDTLKKEHEEQQLRYESELREAAIAAETASRSKSTFLANMSHEIRTPMNSIIGFSELAMNDHVSPQTKDYLSKIIESSEGLLQIINDVLDISKIESGKIVLEKIPFALHDVFKLCQMAIMPKALEKGIALYCYAEPSIGKKLLGDPTRLRQVLINLLSNAVKFTNTGVVKLLSSIDNATDDGITVHFEVKDSGIGMTPEQIEKIYEPFVQADSSTTRKYGGTGLGLAITKNIVELMGSQLDVRSEPGIGSKFSFDLTFETVAVPFDELAEEAEAVRYEKPAFTGDILLCEDNRMNQQVISEHLSRVGLRTVIASNGKEGVSIVRQRMENGEKPFDLIFMDIHMPVMDGLEAASILAQIGNETPIVAITANIMAHDRESYRLHGMPDCVAKPFTSQELWSCLIKYLKPVSLTAVNENAYNDEQLHKQLLRDFVKDNQYLFTEIKTAICMGDIKLAHRLAHTLKGTAGLIGKAGLHRAAYDVERALTDNKLKLSDDSMHTLETELKIVLEELAPLLHDPELQTTQAEAIDPEEALMLLAQLEPLLRTGNPQSLKMIDSLRAISGSGALIEKLEDYDFKPALDIIAQIRQTLEVRP